VVVDYERAYLRLREHVLTKRSHGQDELLRVMTEVEIECELSESEEGFDTRPPRRPHSVSDQPALEPAAT
jgi:hypothetical protein